MENESRNLELPLHLIIGDLESAEEAGKQELEHFVRLHARGQNPWVRPANAREEVNQNDAALENTLHKRAPAEKNEDIRTGPPNSRRTGANGWTVEFDSNGEISKAWAPGVDPERAFARFSEPS